MMKWRQNPLFANENDKGTRRNVIRNKNVHEKTLESQLKGILSDMKINFFKNNKRFFYYF